MDAADAGSAEVIKAAVVRSAQIGWTSHSKIGGLIICWCQDSFVFTYILGFLWYNRITV